MSPAAGRRKRPWPDREGNPELFSELERGAWGGLLAVQGGLMRRVAEDLEQNSHVTHPEFEVLLRLWWTDGGRARIQDLAATSLLTRSGLTRVIERLERKGLVTRSRAPEDGRGAYAELTPAGAERFAGAARHHIDYVRREFLSRFSHDELRTLGALLARANDPNRDDPTDRT
jgi:DNA-binding MarR family transcriptional regulator